MFDQSAWFRNRETFNFLLSLSDVTLAKVYRAISRDRMEVYTLYSRGLYSDNEVRIAFIKMSWVQNTINSIIEVRFHNGAYNV